MLPFASLWREFAPDLPTPNTEWLFMAKRRFRFDLAWPQRMIAVEFDGGQWVAHGGRHNRDSDRDKLNLAAALGWRVLRFSNQQFEADPVACLALIRQALEYVSQ
jgi:very-short-patch-repair endonuclease